jgi:hypothetical protein
MKKKLLVSGMLLCSIATFALNWTVNTTCGKKASIQTSENVSDAQMQQYVAAINYDLCSTIPQHITITR